MKAGLHAPKAHGIFLLYEGLPPTIIESQVLAHARAMGEAGIRMEVWAFALKRETHVEALRALPRLLKDFQVEIRVFKGVHPSLPWTDRLNALLLFWRLKKSRVRPQFVHARTERAAAIAAIAKTFLPFRLIWDSRGDTLGELKADAAKYPATLNWLAALMKERMVCRRLKMAAGLSDAAIFVSDALRRLQGPSLVPERTLIVPCLADERLFYYSSELRAQTRSALGYRDSDRIIVYIGSTAAWQCVPETVALMERAMRIDPAVKALIVTPNIPAFESMIAKDLRDRVSILSGTLKEMNRYLNAADFGVLLRKDDAINRVASPVKFAEYSLTGLTVVTTGAIEQVVEFGRRLNNTVDVEDFISIQVKGSEQGRNRAEIAESARAILGRNAYLDVIAKFYTGP